MSPLQAGDPAGTQSARLTHDQFLSGPHSSPLVSWDCVHHLVHHGAWAAQLLVMLKTAHQQGGVYTCQRSTPAWTDCHLDRLSYSLMTLWTPGSGVHSPCVEVTPRRAFSPPPPDCGLGWQIHARSGDSSIRLSLP